MIERAVDLGLQVLVSVLVLGILAAVVWRELVHAFRGDWS